jgi:hypothetical protein
MEKHDQQYVSFEKLTKKAQKQHNSRQRVLVPFNTGTRSHKTDKNPSRARQKHLDRRNGYDR